MVQNKRSEVVGWCYLAIVFLGFWMILAPVTFGFSSMNDTIVGILFIICGLGALSRHGALFPWVIALAGVWLQVAPFLYRAPAIIYLNDTLIGVLVIAFSLLIPGFGGGRGQEIPAGWSYNPSAWIQRIPIIALACIGWFIARYLGAYQLGYIDTVWDPLFGDGTERVITSSISKAFPVPDAALGAFAYTLEALFGCKGGSARWRTMPWMVLLFAFLVVPLGLVSITLVILQPVIVGAWCFLCLVAALAMLIMIVLTLDELWATCQFLARSKHFWRAFIYGGNDAGAQNDTQTPPFSASICTLVKTWGWGIQFRWSMLAAFFLGCYIMTAPAYCDKCLGYQDADRIIGAFVAVVSMIAMAKVTAKARYLLLVAAALQLVFMTPAHMAFAVILTLLGFLPYKKIKGISL